MHTWTLTALLFFSTPQAGTPGDARALMSAMAELPGLEARFVETKKLALLKAPLRSTGVLYYTRPGYLVRIVEAPTFSKVRIGPDALKVSDAAGEQTFDLSARPDIKTFVESFVHVMAGNYDALAATYDLAFTPAAGPGTPWTLLLTPKRPPLSNLVERLEVVGVDYRITTIAVLERRGDRTDIAVTEANPERTFTAAERERIFGLR